MKNKRNKLVAVAGTVGGNINGITITGSVTGTADRETGHVTNTFHGINPEIGRELSQIVIGLTIVCMEMGKEIGEAKNLSSMAPNRPMKRIATYTLESHTMQCIQTVEWPMTNVAIVTIEYSGSLPSFSGKPFPIPDVVTEYRQTGPNEISQIGETQAAFDGGPQKLSIDIKATLDVPKIAWSKAELQLLENKNNSAYYDEKTQKIIYNTDVSFMEA